MTPKSALLSAFFSVLVAACSSSSSPRVGTVNPLGSAEQMDGGTPTPSITQDCSGLAKSQTVSQPCCLADGVDACGAMLFCAAFDGRTQPTCYLDHTRLDGTECSGDAQCASGTCNMKNKKCKSMPGATCNTTTGCAAYMAQKYICAAGKCTTTTGAPSSACETDSDCKNGSCDPTSHCAGKTGATCHGQSDCSADLCCKGNGSDMQCQDCRGGAGDQCGAFFGDCRPGLSCCDLSGGALYCEASCH